MEKIFFTSINIEIEHETMMMRYISAGHPPFILIRKDQVFGFPEFGASGTNLPIAIKDAMEFSAGEWKLQKGDKLILYTDGLTEMPLRKKEKMISLKELKIITRDILSKCSVISVSDLMDHLLSRISEISDEKVTRYPPTNTSGDDVTLLCMEVEDQSQFHVKTLKPRSIDETSVVINKLCEELSSEFMDRNYDLPEMRIRMVVEEALMNAWTHGNKQDPDKTIIVRWRFGNDFHFEVIDEGNGFDYHCIPDPRDGNNLTKPFGRGIFMMQYFSDGVSWRADGKHFIAYFKKKAELIEKDPTDQMNSLVFVGNACGIEM